MDEDEAAAPDTEPVIPGLIQNNPVMTPTSNYRTDAPTIYADAVQGAQLSPFTVKLTFIEHFLDGDAVEIGARNVVNLVMPAPQLRAMADLFSTMADELDTATQAMLANGN